MIVFAIVVTLLLMGGLFLLYKGFQIISEDNKLLRLQLHEQQQEMTNIIKDFDYNMIMVLGSELGDNLKKFIKLKGKGDVVLRNGKAVRVDTDY